MTGLGNNDRRVFLGIANGKITFRPGAGAEPQTYDFVEGEVKGITRRKATIKGEEIEFYDFAIVNDGTTFALSVPANGSAARGIILPLYGVTDFEGVTIRISPWLKDEYTNVSVYANGQRLDWGVDPKSLPAVVKVKIGAKEVVDDTDRLVFINGLVNEINARIKGVPVPPAAETKPAPVGRVDYTPAERPAPVQKPAPRPVAPRPAAPAAAAPAPAPRPAARPASAPAQKPVPQMPAPRPAAAPAPAPKPVARQTAAPAAAPKAAAKPAPAAPGLGHNARQQQEPSGPEIPPPTYDDGLFSGPANFGDWDPKDFRPNM